MAGRKTGTTSRFIGVTLFAEGGRFQAFVKVAGKRVHLGMFRNEEDAALARDRAVLFFKLDAPLNLATRARRLGPESPERLRWLARSKQKAEANGSSFFGVSLDRRRRRWAAVICVGDRKAVQIAQFDDPEDAAVAYDRVARSMFGAKALLNFPDRRLRPASMEEMRAWSFKLRKRRTSSRFIGVIRHLEAETSRPWGAQIAHGGRHQLLGSWESEHEAAVAYDRAALYLVGPTAKLNFPSESPKVGPASPKAIRDNAYAQFKATKTSRFRGVHRAHRTGNWVAQITAGGRAHHLGTFVVEEDAAETYDRAAKKLHGRKAILNFFG